MINVKYFIYAMVQFRRFSEHRRQMFIDERNGVGDVSGGGDTARLPWLASKPSAATELVCVGKIKSNGVSQSLFIDRSKWPPKTSQHHGGPQTRPQHQTRAAAVVAAAAVAAAAAPKVICISPVANAQRSHTVIRRAMTTEHNHHNQLQQQGGDVVYDNQKASTSEVPVVGVVPSVGCDATVSIPSQTSKRTFEQTSDPHHLRPPPRSAENVKSKAARLADADAVVPSSTTSTIVPGSSVLLPGWASKGSAEGRHQLRRLLPRAVDMPPACTTTMTNVITIVPTVSSATVPPLCNEPVAPSESLSSTTVSPVIASDVESTVAACTQTASVASTSSTCTADTAAWFNRCSAAPRSVQAAKDRNEPGVSKSQWLQRIRLIEREMRANDSAPAKPFCINIAPLQYDRPPTQCQGMALVSPSPSDDDNDDDDDEQPPKRMLEALRLVRNPRRDVIVTSSSATSATRASTNEHRRAVAPACTAATRLVTMKLVNRCTH